MTTADFTTSVLAPPTGRAGMIDTATTYAGRTLRQFVRTPQLIVVGALTSTMFLLIFRYVFGGAIDTGDVAYVDFLIPGLAAAGAMFSGTGGAVGVAEDVDSGLYDRLRSLPIPRSAVLIGRSLADTALVGWGLFVTVAVGVRDRVPVPRFGARRRRRGRPVPRLRGGVHVAVHLHGPGGRQRPGGQRDVDAGLPVRVRLQRLRARRVDARLAAADRRAPADHADGRCGAGPDARRPGRGRPRPQRRVVRRAGARLVGR